MTGNTSLMGDLERAMATRSDQRRSDTLRKVTDLFVENAPASAATTSLCSMT
jgi:hypothetical protein